VVGISAFFIIGNDFWLLGGNSCYISNSVNALLNRINMYIAVAD